jgi:hypothetical protein
MEAVVLCGVQGSGKTTLCRDRFAGHVRVSLDELGSRGREAALASERSYVTRTLPGGVLRGLRDGLRGDVAGLLRASAIATGLTMTVAGYLRGRLAT